MCQRLSAASWKKKKMLAAGHRINHDVDVNGRRSTRKGSQQEVDDADDEEEGETRTSLLTPINWKFDEEDPKSTSTTSSKSPCCGSSTDNSKSNRAGIIPARFLLVALCSLGCVVVYTTRVDMSMALVCMVNQSAIAERSRQRHGETPATMSSANATQSVYNCPSHILRNQTASDGSSSGSHSEDGPFVWEEELQGIVLSSFFWGYVVTQFPAGIIADKIGGKWIWGYCLLATSMLTMAVPMAARVSVYLVILVRFLSGLAQGVTFPTINSILATWIPQQERSILMSLATMGCSIGNIVAFPVSAFLCKSTDGWENIFYVFGGLGLIWFCLWACSMSNKPADHPWISDQERSYIEQNTKCNRNSNRAHAIRWKSLLTSPAFLSLCFVSFTGGFKFFMLLTQLPTYVRVVLDFDLAENGLINVVPHLIAMPTAILAGLTADYIKNTGRFKVTNVRKTFAFIGSATSAFGLIAVPLAGCDRNLVLALIWASMGIDALNAGGLDTNAVDMAPNISGTTTGISNSFAAVGGILAPYIVGILTQNNDTKQGWDAAFYLSSAISLVGLTTFMIFGSFETQPWNESVDRDADQLLDQDQNHD